jgi:hypothetical protein
MALTVGVAILGHLICGVLSITLRQRRNTEAIYERRWRGMTKEQAIAMIDEYLLEPNNISKEWVECLRLCRAALVKEEGEADV